MPTKAQVEEKLRSLDYDGFLAIAQTMEFARGAGMTDQEWREHRTDWILRVYDKENWELKVPLLRALSLPTDEESQLNMQAASTDAAVRSATTAEHALEAAERSAKAALRSATAAEKSEQHAESMKHARWVAIGLSSVALLVAVGHIIVNVVIAITNGQQ